tara:strand:- start:1 stop:303 length:303 start_codon:yes stop_codon:yes gene_type:complete
LTGGHSPRPQWEILGGLLPKRVSFDPGTHDQFVLCACPALQPSTRFIAIERLILSGSCRIRVNYNLEDDCAPKRTITSGSFGYRTHVGNALTATSQAVLR